jgi:hypothetical protein
VLGGEEFVVRCRALIDPQKPLRDIPRTDRYAGRPSLKDLLGSVPPGACDRRNTYIGRVSRARIHHAADRRLPRVALLHREPHHTRGRGRNLIIQDLTPTRRSRSNHGVQRTRTAPLIPPVRHGGL